MESKKIYEIISRNSQDYNASEVQQELAGFIADNFFDIYWILDNELKFLYVSNGFLGYDKSEIIGKKLPDFLPQHEKDKVLELHLRRKEKQKSGQSFCLEHIHDQKIYTKDNEIADIKTCILPFLDEDNIMQGFVGACRKIPPEEIDQSQTQDELIRYKELFSNLRTGIFKTTAQGNFIYVNDQLAGILGYNSADDLLKSNVNLLDLYVNPDHRKNLLKLLQDSDRFERFTTQFYDYERMVRRVELTVRAYKDENGEIEFIEGLAYDISGQDIYMRKLERAKSNLNVLIQSTKNAYILFSADLKIITWNTRAQKIADIVWGVDLKIGKSLSNIAPLKELGIEKTLKNVIAQRDYQTEQVISKGERKYYLNYSFQPVVLDSGKTDAIVMGIEDDTNIKETQNRLHSTIKELQDIFENSLTAIMVVDENRVIRKVNSRACELFGYTRDELINQTTEIIHCSKASFREFGALYDKVFHNEVLHNTEFTFCKKSGEKIILRFNGKTVMPTSESDSAKVIWNLQDITEINKNRKVKDTIYKISQALHKDEKLSDLLEEIRNHLSAIIKVGNFMIALYDESRDAFTLPVMADAHDRFIAYDASGTISKLVVKENQSYFVKTEQIQELIDAGKIKVKGAMAKVWLGVPMRVKGKPIGLIVVQDYENEGAYSQEDLTMLEFLSEQVSMAIANKKNEEQLKENVETKNKFFSIIAHDLKSPFNSLIGLSDILYQGMVENEEERTEIYKNLNKTAKEGYSLLENLLFWTRSQLGKVEHNEELFQLKYCISSVFTLLENNANLKNIQLVSYVDEDTQVWGDKNKIKTILRNLVSNSLKYSHSGSKVVVDAKKNDHDIVISIQDFGIGMPETMTDKLFKMGDNTKRPGTDNEKGTGLGLLISKEFVEHHNGHIWVESKKDEGSIFYVSLPLKKKKIEKYQGVQSARESKKEETKNIDKKTILVVEDVQVNLLLLQKMLEKMNYHVASAKNGQEAVDYVENNKPDLILMDINMPVLDGIQATELIKQKHPEIPIIIQTAYTSEENKTGSKEAGADGYLEKPISKEKLSNYLKIYL
ncbi:MAG: PAS domain S-box protein [Bacteroidales bacterium]|nr:PAS domain S-box protein [Bacteroidales bacterium]MCF8327618.1 PAS domain S-box protein [Bacteroidales bacterium]